MNIESIKQCIEKIEKELVELKAYVDEIKVEKTPNQLRYEIIEKAKSFVEIKSNYLIDSSECDGGFAAKKRENPNYCSYVMKCDFVVNAEKRTVVAILKHLNNSIRTKSIAKCNPSDVFNEHIGKAIALGRALGLDVSEFENAVQPSKYAIGQIGINRIFGSSKQYEITKVGKGEVFKKLFEPFDTAIGDTTKPLFHNDNFCKSLTIINDTNAIYGGFE